MSLGGLLRIVAAGVGLVAFYLTSCIIYNIFLHPLRRFPGPLWMRATRLVHDYKVLRGTLVFDMLTLHAQYGDVVRIAPNELAFANPSAWRAIMGHRTKHTDRAEFEKFEPFYNPIGGPKDVVGSSGQEHAMLRRLLSHGFSERSLREQQPLIMGYVELLVQRLREQAGNGPVDLRSWYNYVTFDIIGDLAFGESFGCLRDSDYHPWVRMLFSSAKLGTVLQTATFYPVLRRLIIKLISSPGAQERLKAHEDLTREKLLRRMELGNERPDLVEGLLRKKEEWNIPTEQIQANCGVLIIAGSETTATLLAGATFLLLQQPETLRKLTREVRSAFATEDEIDMTSVNKLPYLFACLDEALRMYPPVAVGLPRVCPKGGAEVSGHFVPEDTICGIHHWALYHSDKHFKDPFTYRPERWLGDPDYAGDNLEAVQPFQVGPRNCLGRNLANLEMRVIMARLVWNFDMTLDQGSRGWLDQKVFNFWDKPALMVHLTPATRD